MSWQVSFGLLITCLMASDKCPALLRLETQVSRLNIQYIIHVSCCDITHSHSKAGLVGNGFFKVSLLYSCSKTKQGQSWECVECVCVIVPAAPTLPGHAGRHQGHTHAQRRNTYSPWSSFNCWSYELFVNPIDLLLSFWKQRQPVELLMGLFLISHSLYIFFSLSFIILYYNLTACDFRRIRLSACSTTDGCFDWQWGQFLLYLGIKLSRLSSPIPLFKSNLLMVLRVHERVFECDKYTVIVCLCGYSRV